MNLVLLSTLVNVKYYSSRILISFISFPITILFLLTLFLFIFIFPSRKLWWCCYCTFFSDFVIIYSKSDIKMYMLIIVNIATNRKTTHWRKMFDFRVNLHFFNTLIIFHDIHLSFYLCFVYQMLLFKFFQYKITYYKEDDD